MEALCGKRVSRSLVSNLAKELDDTITKWRSRPLTLAYSYLAIDARYEDIRGDGLVSRQAVLIVIGISETGHREILSVDIGNSEREQEWTDVFKRLKARGLRGVQYVVSDSHQGLVKALRREFQGTSWQRCQVHFLPNFMSRFSRKELKEYVPKLKDVFSAPDIAQARERKER